jgi:GNAT superfamily N-acetyltransferase
VTASFVIAPLGPDHNRLAFSSGVDVLDRYLHTQAGQDVRRHLANCFVASPVNTNAVAGYYTFSAASVAINDLTDEYAKRLPRYPVVPAALIGRLAIDSQYKRQGLGAALLFDAVERALRSEAAIYAIIVDAKDDTAMAFYSHHGFQEFTSRPRSLFLPVATALKLISKR